MVSKSFLSRFGCSRGPESPVASVMTGEPGRGQRHGAPAQMANPGVARRAAAIATYS